VAGAVRMPHWNRRCALLETPPYQAKLGGDPIPRHQPPSYRSLIEATNFQTPSA